MYGARHRPWVYMVLDIGYEHSMVLGIGHGCI